MGTRFKCQAVAAPATVDGELLSKVPLNFIVWEGQRDSLDP